jgi:hypothetical protein
VERLARAMHDGTCQWKPHAGFVEKTDEAYHLNRAAVLAMRWNAAYAEGEPTE